MEVTALDDEGTPARNVYCADGADHRSKRGRRHMAGADVGADMHRGRCGNWRHGVSGTPKTARISKNQPEFSTRGW